MTQHELFAFVIMPGVIVCLVGLVVAVDAYFRRRGE